MFNIFTKAKKPEATIGTKDSLSVEDCALRLFTSKYAFEVNTDFCGLKGWPSDVTIVSYFPEQGVLCAGTESGDMIVYGRNLQHFRPRLADEPTSVKNIVSVGIDMCLVIYTDSSLAVFKLPCLELLDTISANWMTNSDEFGEVDISCVHVDEYTEKNLKTFVYIGTDLGDVHVLDISPRGSIKICDYTISCRDVELSCQMRVTAILSDDKCLMIGYDKAGFVDDVDSNIDSSSRCSSPRDTSLRFPNFSSEVREAPSPSKTRGVVVVFNITKRRVRHSYPMGSGVSFLIWDSVGDSLYAVLRSGEIFSLTAASGKSLSTLTWSALASKSKAKNGRKKFDEIGDEDEEQIVKKIRYLPPQTENNQSKYGGSFMVLLNTNNIVGLSPSGPHGELMVITSFLNLDLDEVTDFLIIPTFQPDAEMSELLSKSFHLAHATPALLLVSKPLSNALGKDGGGECPENSSLPISAGGKGKTRRVSNQLKTIPFSAAISTIPTIASGATAIDVAVAIAVAVTEKDLTTSTDPRDGAKVALPFDCGQKLSTCITALPPCISPTSIATVLIAHPKDEKPRSQEIATRRSSDRRNTLDESFELVLAAEDVDSKGRSLHSSRFYDIVFLGQKDGFMSAWACYPALEQNKEKHDRSYNCVWHHLRNFNVRDLIVAAAPDHKNSLATVFAAHQLDSNPESQDVFRSFSVTVLCAEEGSGLMSAGTSGGNVVVWEAYQSNTARGFAEHTAGKCSWSDSQLSVYRMENGGDGSSSSKKLSPKSKIGKGTLFSWDEDEDEEDDDDSEDDENFDDGDENRPSPTSLNLFKSRHDLKVENVYQSNDDADLPLSQSNLNDVPEHQKIDHGASSLEEAPFRPDDIRELFRAKVPGSVTCQLLVSEILILVVGTSLGSVWISRGFNEEAFTEVDLSGLLKISPAPVGSEHYVSGILYSAYSWDADSGSGSNPDGPALIPVVYVTFSCGNVAVICLQTSALVAYGLSEENEDLASSQSIVKKKWLSTSKLLVGGKDGDDDSDITDTNTLKLVVAAVVTDSVNEVIHAPKCRATYSSNRSVVDGKEVLSFSFVSLTRQEACSGNIQSQEQTSTRSRASSTVDAFATFRTPKGTEEDTPSNVLEIPTPRYLLVTVWKSLVKYDISKFSRLTIPVSGGRSKRSYSISAPSVEALESLEPTFTGGKANAQTSRMISRSTLIAGSRVNFKERSAPCLASTCPCLLTVSSHGRLTNTSVRHQLPLGDVSLFTDLMSDSSSDQNSKTEISNTEGSIDQGESKVFFNSILRSGTLLSNGSGYFLQKSGLIISTCLSATNSKLLVKQAGQRHAVHDPLVVPQIALFGSQEQESKISVCQSSLKNKQSSMFGGIKTGHSGPADLLKLFSKLRDTGYVRGKDKFEFNKSSPHTTSSASASASNARDDYDNGFDKSPRIARKSIFSVSKDKSSNVTRQTDAVQNVMADTMRSLEERGEKLSKLNNQADEISQNASTFRDLAKIHKNNMDKKANKWGGIL